jgi:hypothetical protein
MLGALPCLNHPTNMDAFVGARIARDEAPRFSYVGVGVDEMLCVGAVGLFIVGPTLCLLLRWWIAV